MRKDALYDLLKEKAEKLGIDIPAKSSKLFTVASMKKMLLGELEIPARGTRGRKAKIKITPASEPEAEDSTEEPETEETPEEPEEAPPEPVDPEAGLSREHRDALRKLKRIILDKEGEVNFNKAKFYKTNDKAKAELVDLAKAMGINMKKIDLSDRYGHIELIDAILNA